ncbi:MAG: N-acetylmuramoyl-L-alanine amidase [Pseudomonadota bacterium]
MRPIDLLVGHCSATPAGRDVSAAEIDRWHRARRWNGIGYHYVIRLDGTIEHGRPENIRGAHVRGRNRGSLGVCLIGGVSADDVKLAENTFNDAQFASLETLIRKAQHQYGDIDIVGHRDLDPGKACPSFDVERWLLARGLAEYGEAA